MTNNNTINLKDFNLTLGEFLELQEKKQHIKKEWLSPDEVSKEYGFSKSTLAKNRMANKGIKYSKVGKYIKYKRTDIESFLNSNIIEVEGA